MTKTPKGSYWRRNLCLAAGALLAGCETGIGASPRVALAPGIIIDLPLPAELGRSVDVAQLIEIRHGDHNLAFEGRLSVTPERLLLVGTDPAGRRALTATWTGRSLEAEAAPWLPPVLRVANVIGDIIVLFWPLESVRRVLQPAGAMLVERAGEMAVVAGSRDIVRLQYKPSRQGAWNGTAVYDSLGWGYRLAVRSTELAA